MQVRRKFVNLLTMVSVTLMPLAFVFSSYVEAGTVGVYEWTKTVGGSGDEAVFGVYNALDSSGNIYYVGTFEGTVDFDPGAGSDSRSGGGAFITKLNSAGQYQWTNVISVTESYVNIIVMAVDIGNSDDIYITGYFSETVDFDPSASSDNKTSNGHNDVFVSKYDSSGNYEWANIVGGISDDRGNTIKIDSNENVLVGGSFSSSTVDFDPGAGVDMLGGGGGFVSKYDSNGGYLWTKIPILGNSYYENVNSIGIDSSDSIVLGGKFQGTKDFDPSSGTDEKTSNGGYDIYYSKYNSSADYLWTKTFGSSSDDWLGSIMIGSSDSIYVVGDFSGTVDFDPGAGTHELTSNGKKDFFLSKYDSTGVFEWANSVGGNDHDSASGVFNDENIFLIGHFGDTVDFDPGTGTDIRTANTSSSTGSDIFVSKYDSSGNYEWTNTIAGTWYQYGSSLSVSSLGELYLSGTFDQTVDFNPGAGTDNRISNGESDVFISKYKDTEEVSITGFGEGLQLEDQGTGLDVSNESAYINGPNRTIILRSTEGWLISEVEVDLTESRDWGGGATTVTGDIDLSTGKSVVANLTTAPGTAATHTLYVPKLLDQNQVWICPNAGALAEITDDCSGGYALIEADSNVEITSEGGQDYWRISGLTGTGGLGVDTSGTPNMRVELADEATSAADDVEVWFDTPTDLTANSLINVVYETDFTGGGSLTAGDVDIYCDADGVEGSETLLTNASLTSLESGKFEIDLGIDTCSDWIKIDIDGDNGNHLTTPGTPGNYSWGVVTDAGGDGIDDDSGAVLAYVANENDVTVTAKVPPVIDLEVYEDNTTDLGGLAPGNPNTCTLGTLTLSQIKTCSYYLGTSTNNLGGMMVSVVGSDNGTLTNGSHSFTKATGVNLTAGTEGYGFYLSDQGSLSSNLTVLNTLDSQTSGVPATETGFFQISTNHDAYSDASQRVQVTHEAAMTQDTETGSYSHTVTYYGYSI